MCIRDRACGHTIKGKVAFLGGPLSFLSELRKRFIETLELKDDEVIFPKDSKYFVAKMCIRDRYRVQLHEAHCVQGEKRKLQDPF